MSDTRQQEIDRFLEYLAKGDIVLAYWNPILNELMPIQYKDKALSNNYINNKPPISNKVKRG